jgi:hypothetical protein
VYLDFLARTAPFNLYPFICVVPSGIFIAYYNEARSKWSLYLPKYCSNSRCRPRLLKAGSIDQTTDIKLPVLDENTFETIKTLPNMPGAVNDPTAGRTYQLEGSMVLLPQHAPYTDPLGVLICGGSTSGGGYAIDNCVTTQPEADKPTWEIERMVCLTAFWISSLLTMPSLHAASCLAWLVSLMERILCSMADSMVSLALALLAHPISMLVRICRIWFSLKLGCLFDFMQFSTILPSQSTSA